MPESLRSKRLSPPLMHAFRGAHPDPDERQQELEEARQTPVTERTPEELAVIRRQSTRAALTERGLRRQVKKDVVALMNTIALESTLDLSEFDYVRRSILNFGCPDISDRTIDEHRLSEVRDEIEEALKRYEPRLIADTLKVTRELVDEDLKLRYVVRADLACIPVSVPVQFVADVEVDAGVVNIVRL